MKIRLRPYETISQDFLTNLYANTMTDSIWGNPAYAEGSSTGTKFLSKLPEGEPVTLTFTALNKREQREDTKPEFRSEDGTEFVFFFQDEEGNEKEMSQKSAKGKFFSAMRDAHVEPGEIVSMERNGSGIDVTWKIIVQEKIDKNPLI